MKGNCRHGAYKNDDGLVELCNDDDSFYHTVFENWDEIHCFIAEIEEAAEAAFGKETPEMDEE